MNTSSRCVLIITLIYISTVFSFAQTVITGPTFVSKGQTATYSYTGSSSVSNPRWATAKQAATIVSSSQSGSTYSVVIRWNGLEPGADQVIFLSGTTSLAQLDVFVNCTSPPATPSVTFTISTNVCGNKTITYSGTPPSGVQWFWLSAPEILNTTNATSTYIASASGTYYVRAKSTNADECWSTGYAQINVTVNQPPATPPAFTVSTNTCDAKTLTRPTAIPNVSWFWQGTDSQGTLTDNGTATYQAIVSGVYYLRARTSAGCWSNNSSSANVTVVTTPATPTTATNATAFKNSAAAVVSVGAVAGATGYKWYGPSGIITSATSNAYQPAASVTTAYQVSAVNQTCESPGKIGVSVTVLADPQISVQNNIPPVVTMRKPITLVVNEAYTTYTWKRNGVVVGTGSTFMADQPGEYIVVVTRSGVYGEGISAPLQVLSGTDNLDMNYIIRNVVQDGSVTNPATIPNLFAESMMQTIQYFDELGRPIQEIATQGSPLKNDLVKPVKYDAFGREASQFLPYSTQEGSGWYKANAVGTNYGSSAQKAYYANGLADIVIDDSKPYSDVVFEASPLNRVLKEYQPGSAWGAAGTDNPNGKDKYIGHAYLVNTHSTGASSIDEKIIAWKIDANGLPVRYAQSAGTIEAGVYYSSEKLYIKVTTDEHNNAVREYTNKKGQVVLKKVQVVSGSGNLNSTTDWALTYYIYDIQDNLRYVFPPELSKTLHTNADTYVITATDLANWAFQYKYDKRKRMAEKKVPGADWVYMVYDERDRLVLTQDGNQRAGATNAIKYWTFTKYDELNRPIVTGIKDTTTNIQLTQAEMQNVVDTYYSLITTTKPWRKYSEKYIGAAARNVHGYSNYSYPVVTAAAVVDPFRYLTITYYDNYTFKSLWQDTYGYISDGLTEAVNGVTYTQPGSENLKIIGQVTGMKVKVLDGGIAGGNTWLKAVNYFDDKYRVIQTIGDNYKGGSDRASNLYDFTGKVLRTKSTHIENDILWKDLAGATFAGNYLKNTAASSVWGNSGAASVQSLPANQDGWVEFTASAGNVHLMVGLSAQNADANYTSIGYALYLRNTGLVSIFEGGGLKRDLGAYNAGDIFRIQRVGTAIKYFQNGHEIYPGELTVTQTPSSSSLLVDVSIYTVGATVLDAKSSFSNSSHTISRHFLYDHAGRLKKIYHQVDAQPEVLLSSNEYNELGQLVDKGLHSVNNSTPMQSVDYRYNIRGWLTSINNSKLANDGTTNNDAGDFFGMNLGYNERFSEETNTLEVVSGYSLDGNANDQSTTPLNGTVTGATTVADNTGNANKAYHFNGTTSNYIRIADSQQKHSFIQNTGKFTITAFIKLDDLAARNIIVSSIGSGTTKGFTFYYETIGGGSGEHQLRFTGTVGQASYNVALGGKYTINDLNWHHVAVTGDGQNIRFYVDGIADGSATPILYYADGNSTYETLIGCSYDANGARTLGMKGAIDELYIFDRALSQFEIQKMAQRASLSTVLDNGQYNGNISAIKWSNQQGIGPVKEYGYNFTYDALNRLSTATHSQSKQSGIWEDGLFHESGLLYDLNGNIMALQRSSELGLIDNLAYNYGTGVTQSNKLLSVTDKTANAITKLKGFPDFNATGTDYTYDVNGNMTRDLNKGIGATLTDATNLITYNYLNLPETITKSGNTIRYIYDATGRKLTQRVSTLLSVKQTDYSGEFIYEDDLLRFINHEEGRVVMSSEKLMYTHDGENATGLTALNTTLAPVTLNGEKYIRVTSNGAVIGSGIFPIGNTLQVTAGEKYLIRAKGYKTGANNVVIQLKSNAMSTVFYGSYLPGSVATESWMEQMFTVPVGTTQLQVGVGWGTVTTGQQFFLNEFEVIRLTTAAPEYQYNLKDHLGNVRLTFTSKLDVEAPKATFEDANVNTEQGQFLRYENARRVNHYLFDHTNGSSPTAVAGGAQRLSGQTNEVYGLARSISVMPGDVINMEVYAKYIDPNSSNWSAALNTLITQIASGTTSNGTVIDGGSYTSSTTAFPFPVDAAQNTSGSNEAGPKAFLSWLVYDRNYNLIPSKSGFRQMSSAAKENGSDVAHELLSGSLTITEPGYVYVFLSNEQGTNPYEVYFDDFRVEQVKSPVIQAEDYYPFGLVFNSFSRESSVPDHTLYNSMELQDEFDLKLYDYMARQYDPVIGRFLSVDPLADVSRRWSPYAYAYDNPVRYIDPDGMLPEDKNGPKEYKDDHLYITVTYSEGPMSQSTNTVTETHTTSSGKIEIDDEGNETFVEKSTTTTTTQVIGADGETVSQSQTTSNSEKRTEVKEGTQAHLFGANEKIKVKGKELSSKTTTTTTDKFNASNEFKNVVTLTSEYSRLNPGSSINHATTDYFSSLNKNQTADEGMRTGAVNTGMAWVAFASESKKQIYYDRFNGGVYVDKTRPKPKMIWHMGN
ncbi:DUF6443 domain-containing protein [Ohtaekwangia koreensis]|uniref:RHS repeat-associated core domain-containing protein n=1 Tax=Ohtaekwangia koreensis TaxID=688867 RepID=A0A1T5JUT6_9BACT|nr:DUF6443 domain-containing protein [Ohtaekwangia koreensis]SKC55115.1 RHS repeat-associated core domain-containing protein [Ohtaekwangia koreensis]